MMDDLISRRAMLDVLPRFHFRSMNDYLEAEYYIENLPSTQTEPIKNNIEDFNKEDWERFKKEWENTPITVLPAHPDDRVKKIADLLEGTIDHFDREDAMDLLYQIKEVIKND